MKKSLLFIVSYFLFWLLFFEAGRLIFLLINSTNVTGLNWQEVSLAFVHGIWLDMSIAGYVSVLVVLATVFLWNKTGEKVLYVFTHMYTLVTIVVASFLVLLDASLYQFWNAKLSSEVLKYTNDLIGILETVRLTDVLLPFFLAFCLGFSSYVFFKMFLLPQIKNKVAFSTKTSVVTLLVGANLMFAIRGGIDINPEIAFGTPLSSSKAYYSKHSFCNHLSLNPIWWYSLYTLSMSQEDKNKYTNYYKNQDTLERWLNQLRKNEGAVKKVLSLDRPDVVLIVVESLSGHVFGPLGGYPLGTPNLNKWTKKSLLFDHFYASGSRSDKGISTIFTGIPNIPNRSIMQFPDRFYELPYLTQDLNKHGYSSSFYYGGDMGFINFESFFLEAGTDKIVSRKDYPVSDWKSKWGVPDGQMLKDFLVQIDHSVSPSFNSIFTLSSHHPFDIPEPYHFEGNNDDTKYLSSIHYTDACLGEFLNDAEKRSWWDHTLVLIVADHSVNNFGKGEWNMPSRFRIPMIWTGGALKQSYQGRRISTYGGQADIASTLLSQLDIPNDRYKWGKDLLLEEPSSYAFYGNSNIAGFVADSAQCVLNFETGVMKDSTGIDNYAVNPAKAYLQLLTRFYYRN